MRPEFYDGDEGCSGGKGQDALMRVIVVCVGGGAVALVAAVMLAAFGLL